MKTLLAYTAGAELADDYFARKIPVGLGILNAVLNEAGFPSQVGNFSRFSDERVVQLLERERPDVLGLSVFTFNRHASHRIARLAKRVLPEITLVAGVTPDQTAKVKAGELVGNVAGQVGGKGGGRPDFAQAGGNNPAALGAALASVEGFVRARTGERRDA